MNLQSSAPSNQHKRGHKRRQRQIKKRADIITCGNAVRVSVCVCCVLDKRRWKWPPLWYLDLTENSVDLSMITLRCRRHFTQGKRRRRRRKEEEGGGRRRKEGGDTPPSRQSQRITKFKEYIYDLLKIIDAIVATGLLSFFWLLLLLFLLPHSRITKMYIFSFQYIHRYIFSLYLRVGSWFSLAVSSSSFFLFHRL